MTALSVNLNKIALLRNSRGRNYPDLLTFAHQFIQLGVQGITIHPRPDERHITRQDTYQLANFVKQHNQQASKVKLKIELNIEGYPSEDFIQLISETLPDQCTLVPDAVDQLTSDHGWDFKVHQQFLEKTIAEIQQMGVRVAVFLDPDPAQVTLAAAANTDRIELYTESYAAAAATEATEGPDATKGPEMMAILEQYRLTTSAAQQLGIGVNAGHDLDLNNLEKFLTIPAILEVSIGHALMVECLEQGMQSVVSQYLAICHD